MGLVLGTDYPPLHPPSPGALFFGARQGKGGRRRPYDALVFPAPSPTSPPRCHARSWRGKATLGREAGAGAGAGPNAHPTTHELNLKTPIDAPTPTRATGRAPPQKRRWAENAARQHGWGKGLGGFSRSLPQLYPPPPKVCPPPSDVRADGRHGPWREGGSVGLGSGYMKQAEVVASGSAT